MTPRRGNKLRTHALLCPSDPRRAEVLPMTGNAATPVVSTWVLYRVQAAALVPDRVPQRNTFDFPTAQRELARYRSHLRDACLWVTPVRASAEGLDGAGQAVDSRWIALVAHSLLRTSCVQAVDKVLTASSA